MKRELLCLALALSVLPALADECAAGVKPWKSGAFEQTGDTPDETINAIIDAHSDYLFRPFTKYQVTPTQWHYDVTDEPPYAPGYTIIVNKLCEPPAAPSPAPAASAASATKTSDVTMTGLFVAASLFFAFVLGYRQGRAGV